MDTITSFSKDNYEWKVKFYKKIIMGITLWLTFNLSVVFFDAVAVMRTHNCQNGIAFGMMLVTCLWSFVYLISALGDLKRAKSYLKFHTELYEKQLASNEREQYLNAKQAYEQMMKTYSTAWNSNVSVKIDNSGIGESNKENKK
jgi:hypothetical protein